MYAYIVHVFIYIPTLFQENLKQLVECYLQYQVKKANKI